MARASNGGSDHGRVRILPCDESIPANPVAGIPPTAIYRWLPPASLRSHLPSGFCFDFVMFEHNGTRRFRPLLGADQMVHLGFLCGIAFLARDPSFTREDRNTYRAMKLIFNRAQTLREHQTRRFRSPADLYVRRTGRGGGIEQSVLPESVGKQSNGTGRRWSPSQLIAEGRRRAAQQEHEKVDCERAISYGLMAAAERNLLHCGSREVVALMRRVLFDFSQADISQGRRQLRAVTDRVFLAIAAHLDDSQAEFNRWFSGPNSNLMKSIASWSADGPQLTVDEARWGFLELAWRSYQHMARCINAFCRHFLLALPRRLNRQETTLFRQMYFSQPHLGGLSISLVQERIPLLGPILPEILKRPRSSEARFVLYRMLDFYADMVEMRRSADRQRKQLRAGSVSVRQERSNVEHIEAGNSRTPTGTSQLTEYVRIVLEKRGLRCSKCNSDPDVQLPQEGPIDGSITVEYWCPRHPKIRKARISVEELRKAADAT